MNEEPSLPAPADTIRRALLLRLVKKVLGPMPDALLALVLLAWAVVPFIPYEPVRALQARWPRFDEQIAWLLIAEGAFVILHMQLTDIATRVEKRPPVWLIAGIAALLLFFNPQIWYVVKQTVAQGAAAFLPLAISMIDRFAALRRMPGRSKEEKIAARALASNRFTVALWLFFYFIVLVVVGVATWGANEPLLRFLFLLGGAFYFGVAAFDEWRVRQRSFAADPRVLFRFDMVDIKRLDSTF